MFRNSTQSIAAATRKRDATLTVIAALMIISGVAEVASSFRHTFFSIRTGSTPMATYLGVGMGVLYLLAGMLSLATKKSAATLALCLLAAVILGHVAMVVTDLYPTDSISQLFAITLATMIACAFFVAVALKREAFA
jgi:FtsH-binding integral membrane protein